MTQQISHTEPKRTTALMRLSDIMVGIALVLGIALITILIMKSQSMQQINTGKYQVVYLTNGQAYFGKLQNINGDYLVMKTPYTAQSVTPASTDTTKTADTQTTLLKVSAQVYGPEDSIAIKSSQVAFWQNLRDDSKVSQAIKAKE